LNCRATLNRRHAKRSRSFWRSGWKKRSQSTFGQGVRLWLLGIVSSSPGRWDDKRLPGNGRAVSYSKTCLFHTKPEKAHDAKKQGLDVELIHGDDLEALAKEVMGQPADVIALMKKVMGE
jgi:hypothetical protein